MKNAKRQEIYCLIRASQQRVSVKTKMFTTHFLMHYFA